MVSRLAFGLARRLLIVCGDIEMRKLTWKPILSNLRAALGEIDGTYLRLYFLDLGELPDDCPRSGDASYLDLLKRQEERNPLDEMTLFASFEHAYHHLNWAWNCRRTPEKRVWRCADNDFSRWTRFPDTAIFADLWPEKDFARRMHRVYVELNMAWNSRKDKTFATSKCAVARRRLFPSIFATGCHNMWRKKR